MATSKEKIIITGSRGLLGSALCNYFKDSYNVIGLSHKDCDIADNNQIEDKIIKQAPNILINAAALTKVDFCEDNADEAERVNIEGVEKLSCACEKVGCLMVHISTDYVFNGDKRSAYTENDTPGPISAYAKSKVDGEGAVKKILKKFFIVRTSWLFGKKGKDFVDVIINRIKSRTPLRIANDKFSVPTYSLDLSRAIGDLILSSCNYGIYHITNSGGCSWYDFAEQIANLYLGKDIDIEPIGMKDLDLIAKRPKNSVLDNSKFYKAVGYKLRPWQEALGEYINKCYKN